MMYHNGESLLSQAKETGLSLPEIVLRNEMQLSGSTREAIYARMEEMLCVMEASARQALSGGLDIVQDLISGNSHSLYAHRLAQPLCGEKLTRMMAYALSCSETNAAMGKICAAPTAGACGIVPAVLIYMMEEFSLPRQAILDALLVTSGIGAIITANASVSGAVAGCQAECGAAAAMAAGGAVWLRHGSNETVLNAAAMALSNAMGLACDPVAGLVQYPCALRNASQAMNALLSADMALAGVRAVIPFDETVEAMYRTGRKLPRELRETALGGVAATPTAKRIERELHGAL